MTASSTTIPIAVRCNARNQKFRTHPHRKTIPSRIKTSPNTTKLTYAA